MPPLNRLIIWYMKCTSHDQASHMVVDPEPGLVQQLKEEGFTPTRSGLISVKGRDCPSCVNEQRKDILNDIELADASGDMEAINTYARELRQLD